MQPAIRLRVAHLRGAPLGTKRPYVRYIYIYNYIYRQRNHCSDIRHLKNYLRTTMVQERLNHLMSMHVHRESVDKLYLKSVLNYFIGGSEHFSGILLSIS